MIIRTETGLDFDDVCIVPKITKVDSRRKVDLETKFWSSDWNYKRGPVSSGIPIVSANMSSVTSFKMALKLADMGLFAALHKHYTVEEIADFIEANPIAMKNIFVSVGMDGLDKLVEIEQKISGTIQLICLDVANGYMVQFAEFIRKVRYEFPKSIIMAGNVVEAAGATMLASAGANIIKVGIGPSAVCRTRKVAGVGIPQLTAISVCAKAIDGLGESEFEHYICADGGCNTPGDFAKAFGAGADMVMAGTMFGGHEECTDERIDGMIPLYGMSSEHAMNKHNGGMNSYRSSEGIFTLIESKGSVENTVNHILGGIRSACAYTNNSNLKDFIGNVEFVKVNRTYNNKFGD